MIIISPVYEMNAGDIVTINVALYASPGVPAILTAPTGDYVIARSSSSELAIVAKTANITQDVNGLWRLSAALTSDDTSLDAGHYWHQARVFDQGRSGGVVMTGPMIVMPTIGLITSNMAGIGFSDLTKSYFADWLPYAIANLPIQPLGGGVPVDSGFPYINDSGFVVIAQ